MGVLLSFVIPCYRSEKTIEKVVREIIVTVSKRQMYDYEIILVNDCSPDGLDKVLKELAFHNQKIKVIRLAKNMGKQSAVLAGYAVAKGDYIINMDDDYQSPVPELWRLLEPLENDECDYATAQYYEKIQSAFKNIGSNIHLHMMRILYGKSNVVRFENFSIMKKFVCDQMVHYKNPYPHLGGLVLGITQRIKTVQMEQRPRGDDMGSGFTFHKSISVFLNGMTAFSVKPLRIASVIGFLFAIAGFMLGIYTVVYKIWNPAVIAGYSSIAAVLLFSSGLIMLMLGMIGEYVGRIYICINNSPQYVIRDTINL